VEAMYLMLQQDKPEDYVIATGITTSVREFIYKAFMEAGIEIAFEGSRENEKARVVKCYDRFQLKPGTIVMHIDRAYYRPAEVDVLMGDASKARKQLGWTPKYTLDDIIREMVQADIKLFEKEKYLKEGGHKILNYRES
jgi:GDPmannose 4,6-dehydratase